jgi:arylsulfatase A
VLMHAKDSIVVGKNLRYEPEPNKNTVGYWTNPADSVYWEFTLSKAGTFEVEMLQGCGKGSGGSEIEVAVDKQTLPMIVQDTGGFQNFVPRVIGKLSLDAGPHKLDVRVRAKKGAAVMDLRQVTLKPVAR